MDESSLAPPGRDEGSIDDYRLVRPLGDGATFLAHDRFLDRAVVLSLLPEAPAARAASLAVARTFARVSHPNLNRVHRVREGSARPYVVAAFARGQRLDGFAVPLPDARVLEIGRGLAGALAELHGAGVAHGQVTARRVVLSDEDVPCLVGFDHARARADDAAKRADLVALLALLGSIADHDLRASLAGADHGVSTADELRRTLETLARPTLSALAVTENPYRGLRVFEKEHAAAFFGRAHEVVELVERLRAQPWLLVAGRSGTGKSSLVRAGLAMAIANGALGERDMWDVATMIPGAHPVAALARAMAPFVDREGDELAAALGANAALAGLLARGRTERGLLLVVDQLEEAITLASADERDAFCAALARFSALAPGVRVLFTLRGDFLDRLVELGAFGRDLVRAAYVLPGMGDVGLREAIVSPAAAHGFAFESEAMVDALVNEVKHHGESLPLLSFALAELWSARDEARRVLPEEALARLGGAVGALARHGDLVLATLRESERAEARRMLLVLVAASATRVRTTAGALVGTGGEEARVALEALVRGRLVVIGEACELAHGALARAWPRLGAWLDEASEARAVASRLAVAAREWGRLGRGGEGTGGERLLRDLAIPGALDGASDEVRAFVVASRVAVRRASIRRWALVASVPLALASLGVFAWTVSHVRHRAAVSRAIAAARAVDAKAEETAHAANDLRVEAFARFDKDEARPAEELWKRMLALEDQADRERREVGAALDEALGLDAQDPAARALYADVTLARLLAAERRHDVAFLRELRARLDVYDDGSRATLLRAPGHIRVVTEPPGAVLTLARYREDAGHLVEANSVALPAEVPRELEAGSYLIVATAPNRVTTRYPVLVRRGEERALRIVLPRVADVPSEMIYVPAGRCLYGSAGDEATRAFLTHQPIHEIEVGAFLIARTEVSNADYLSFLGTLSASERAERLPGGLTLASDGRIFWKLSERTLAPGAPYCSGVQSCVDWLALPIESASREDGEHYAAWLARSGRLPRARLCTDREWERAARGADDRLFPSGDRVPGRDEACSLATNLGDALHAGPCAIGTHPASRSPFGVDDMAGSEWEWVAGSSDTAEPDRAVNRSGGWRDYGMFLSITNRGTGSITRERIRADGLRVCADLQ
jgi:formylglycine-generating enzyme required for sulfatase activity